MNATRLEEYAKKAWAEMSLEEQEEYDNDFNFFVSDLYFACCT